MPNMLTWDELNIQYPSYPNYTVGDSHLLTRPIEYIVIHHAGASVHVNQTAMQIHNFHKSRGWAGIGYHFWIEFDGTVSAGRSLGHRGAHVGPEYNGRSWGIGLAGNFNIGTPTKAQWESLVALTGHLKENAPHAKIVGHSHLQSTSCPGKLDVVKLRREVEGDGLSVPHHIHQEALQEIERLESIIGRIIDVTKEA